MKKHLEYLIITIGYLPSLLSFLPKVYHVYGMCTERVRIFYTLRKKRLQN